MTIYLDPASIGNEMHKRYGLDGTASINNDASGVFARFHVRSNLPNGTEVKVVSKEHVSYFGLTVEIVRWGAK